MRRADCRLEIIGQCKRGDLVRFWVALGQTAFGKLSWKRRKSLKVLRRSLELKWSLHFEILEVLPNKKTSVRFYLKLWPVILNHFIAFVVVY